MFPGRTADAATGDFVQFNLYAAKCQEADPSFYAVRLWTFAPDPADCGRKIEK